MEGDVRRVTEDFAYLNQPGADEDGYSRLAYTGPEREARLRAGELMAALGLEVRADGYGNVVGLPPEVMPGAISLCGSHLDTVPRGGAWDGAAGVVAALEAVRLLRARAEGAAPWGVVVFAAEESSRFGQALLGSRGFTGALTREEEGNCRDREGYSLARVLEEERAFLEQRFATYQPVPVRQFLELHIEQGPVLESQAARLGVVTRVAAPTRFSVRFRGDPAHSGTTPMGLRRDALAAAGRLITSIEELCRQHGRLLQEDSLVGTVGDLRVNPGSMNVVPGEVELLVDIRSTSAHIKNGVVEMVWEFIQDLVRQRELEHQVTVLEDRDPVTLDPGVASALEDACRETGYPYLSMFSGAGHDAMQMASLCPSGLLFIPCQRGLSHNPHEQAQLEDLALGAGVMARALWQLSRGGDSAPEAPFSPPGGAEGGG